MEARHQIDRKQKQMSDPMPAIRSIVYNEPTPEPVYPIDPKKEFYGEPTEEDLAAWDRYKTITFSPWHDTVWDGNLYDIEDIQDTFTDAYMAGKRAAK